MAHWVLDKRGDKKSINSLNKALGTDAIIGELLVKRGVNSFDDAKEFFRPNATQLHAPDSMLGMNKAVKRLINAKKNQEKILVYGDYDVDGTCAVALTEKCLSHFGIACEGYQPDRFTEGYGISKKGIEYAIAQKINVIIALDCGINAIDMVAMANAAGIDVIICDHHLPKEELPKALAILNPKQKDCPYPFKELCGCGIGFKLMLALEQALFAASTFVFGHLDIVALAAAADIVSLSGENRVLVYLGLIQANQNPTKGIAALINSSGTKKELSCRDMVFQLAPRVNAAGRLYHAQKAKDILLGKDNCQDLSTELNKINSQRQELGNVVFEEALLQAESNSYKFSQVLYSSNWNKGVIGIIASRIIERFYKPCLVISCSEDGMAAGSARTIQGVNVYHALQTCDDLFDSFGGHNAAAGFKIQTSKIDALQKRFDDACAQQLNNKIPEEQIMADGILNLCDINAKLYRILEQFEPCGPDNLAPRFICEDAVLMEKRVIGKDSKHLKIKLSSKHNTNITYDAPLWNASEKINELPEAGEAIQLLYSLEMNHFMGKESIQLRVHDYKAGF